MFSSTNLIFNVSRQSFTAVLSQLQGEDDDATAVKLKNKVQDECDYDEAAVDEERRDASDDEGEAELNLNDENPDDGDATEEEIIGGVEPN